MGNVKIVNSKLLGGAMPLDVTWDQPNFTKWKEIHVRTQLADPVHVRFTQYKNGVIYTCGVIISERFFGRRASLSVD